MCTADSAGLQVHVRHLVGGRARGEQVLSSERLFTVAGPERLGAVRLPPSLSRISPGPSHPPREVTKAEVMRIQVK